MTHFSCAILILKERGMMGVGITMEMIPSPYHISYVYDNNTTDRRGMQHLQRSHIAITNKMYTTTSYTSHVDTMPRIVEKTKLQFQLHTDTFVFLHFRISVANASYSLLFFRFCRARVIPSYKKFK